MTNPVLDRNVRLAQRGSKAALERVVREIQAPVYDLSLRMLWHPEDARDAAQEILIRIVTNLGTFRGASTFRTWVYRVAANYLKTAKRSRLERQRYTFERFGDELDAGLADRPVNAASEPPFDDVLLVEELKIGCTLGMLLCLDRAHRLAYILGDVLELSGPEAAEIVRIEPAAFRKRLSRARSQLVEFMRSRCGLVNPDNACRCHRRLSSALNLKRVDPQRMLFAYDAGWARKFPEVLREIRRLEAARSCAALYRSHPPAPVPAPLESLVRDVIEAGEGGRAAVVDRLRER